VCRDSSLYGGAQTRALLSAAGWTGIQLVTEGFADALRENTINPRLSLRSTDVR
jgi:hypothetical protein